MPKWGTFKWGSTPWGYDTAADSDDALLRAVVGGYASWLPTPDMGAPNGGDPLTGTALYRHAVPHIYLLDDDWSVLTEFVGVTTGSRTSQLSGPLQQDQLQFTLYDPTGYYTDGIGASYLWAGNLIKVTMDITSPGGTTTQGLGVYRLIGFPEVKRSRSGIELTVNGVEWYRNLLGQPFGVAECDTDVPAYAITAPDGQAPSNTGWPTNMFNLLSTLFNAIVCDDDFQTWAGDWFKYQVLFLGQPQWLYSPMTSVSIAIWNMIGGYPFANTHMKVDVSANDPKNGYFNGTPDLNTSLGPDFLIRKPEWQEVLGELTQYNPFLVVPDGDGVLHLRNPGVRLFQRYAVSCDSTSIGAAIPIPVETLDHISNQPEYTTVETYTQYNPTTATDGTVVTPGAFVLRSRQTVPTRFASYPRRQVITWDTITPKPVAAGGSAVVDFSGGPWIDDGTAKARILEIMQAADQITFTSDSAFSYLIIGDEIRFDVPGCHGVYSVISVTQPFDAGAMSVTCAWRADG